VGLGCQLGGRGFGVGYGTGTAEGMVRLGGGCGLTAGRVG